MKQYEFKSGPFDRKRKLLLTENFAELENGDLKGHEFTRLNKRDIVDFKHGMEWIVWYRFTVGREFSITFRDIKNKELKISFKSYFNLNSHYSQMYSEMVDDIWRYYHQDIIDKYLDKFYKSEDLELQGLTVNIHGVKLKGQNSILTWDKVRMKEYYRYFAVFAEDNPTAHSRISYNEYETEILWSIVKTILKEKKR